MAKQPKKAVYPPFKAGKTPSFLSSGQPKMMRMIKSKKMLKTKSGWNAGDVVKTKWKSPF